MAERVTVAVLGLGAMGSRIAANLIESGRTVRAWNRTPHPHHGAGFAAMAPTPAEAAQGARIVLSVVRDDDASAAVWLGADGALRGLAPDAVAVECSTVRPAWSRHLASRLGGHRYLEAPIVGSLPQVEARQLVHLVGGDESAIDVARPVLLASAAAVHHIGGVGSAATLKLAVNALLAAQVFIGAELAGLLGSLDEPDAAAALDVLGQLPVCSPALARALPAIAGTDAPPKRFPLELVEKDLAYALDTVFQARRDAPLVAALAGRARQAVTGGFGDQDIVAIGTTGV